MKRKKTGLENETEIGTVSDLLQRINQEYSKRKKEVEIKDLANRELLTKAQGEEKALIEEITTAKKIAGKMTADYRRIEADVESAAKKEIEKNVLKERDVRTGKVSLSEFNKKGKSDEKIAEEVLKKSVSELETSLNVIRSSNLKILELEERLGDCRNTIRNLVLRPGISMSELFKSLYEFSDVEVGAFMGELESLRTDWSRTKEKIQLTQGKSMSGRHVFERLTMAEARDLQFSPLMPSGCIEKLKLELAKFGEVDGISITLYVNLKEIEITSVMPRRGLIQTTQIKEMPNAGFKRR